MTTSVAHLFRPDPAWRYFGSEDGGSEAGDNPPAGALLYYTLKQAPKEGEHVVLEVLDANGRTVRTLSSKKNDDDEEVKPIAAREGLNRAVWDLRHESARKFKGMILWWAETTGPVVPPGTYTVRLKAGGITAEQPLEVRSDPRVTTPAADLQRQADLLLQMRDLLSESHDAVARIRSLRDDVKATVARAKGLPAETALTTAGDTLAKKLTAVEEALYQTKNQSEQDPLNFPVRLNNKVAHLAWVVSTADAAPTDQAVLLFQDLQQRTRTELDALQALVATDIPTFNALAAEKAVPAVRKPER